MKEYLYLAAKIARPTNENERRRNYYLGCVGIRKDGTIVSSKNGAIVNSTPIPIDTKRYLCIASSHAEGRVLQKLGKHGVLFVSRISKHEEQLLMARPCGMCRTKIKALSVKKVYYSINDDQYGVWFPDLNLDRVYKF